MVQNVHKFNAKLSLIYKNNNSCFIISALILPPSGFWAGSPALPITLRYSAREPSGTFKAFLHLCFRCFRISLEPAILDSKISIDRCFTYWDGKVLLREFSRLRHRSESSLPANRYLRDQTSSDTRVAVAGIQNQVLLKREPTRGNPDHFLLYLSSSGRGQKARIIYIFAESEPGFCRKLFKFFNTDFSARTIGQMQLGTSSDSLKVFEVYGRKFRKYHST